jgi:hypothetical protein
MVTKDYLSCHALIVVTRELQDVDIALATAQSHVVGLDGHFFNFSQSDGLCVALPDV